MSSLLLSKYDGIREEAAAIFIKKCKDYGPSWEWFRLVSLIDQITIKVTRISTIRRKKTQKVHNIGDDIRSEFLGIINYSLIGLIQHKYKYTRQKLTPQESIAHYQNFSELVKNNVLNGDPEIGGAVPVNVETFIEFISKNLKELRQIAVQKDWTNVTTETLFSEIANYAIFALVFDLRR